MLGRLDSPICQRALAVLTNDEGSRYGEPTVAELEAAIWASLPAQRRREGEGEALLLVDAEGDSVVLSHGLPSGLELWLRSPRQQQQRRRQEEGEEDGGGEEEVEQQEQQPPPHYQVPARTALRHGACPAEAAQRRRDHCTGTEEAPLPWSQAAMEENHTVGRTDPLLLTIVSTNASGFDAAGASHRRAKRCIFCVRWRSLVAVDVGALRKLARVGEVRFGPLHSCHLQWR